MRRLVLICMMWLLPVQWTWAVAATYCEHESGAAAHHIGHHEHKHESHAGDATKGGKTSSPPAADNDCGICHFGVQWLFADLSLAAPSATDPPGPELQARFCSHIPPVPVRPDRSLA